MSSKEEERSFFPMINKNINGKLLDVACGTGYYLQLLSNSCECVGSDISKRMIEQCRKKGLKNVLVADYEALPFGNNNFDIILCINAFHYTKSPEKVLHKINRVLKEDGVIILTCKAGLEVIESYACNFLPYPVDGKKRNEAVLKAFEIFEKKIRRTAFKHLANVSF